MSRFRLHRSTRLTRDVFRSPAVTITLYPSWIICGRVGRLTYVYGTSRVPVPMLSTEGRGDGRDGLDPFLRTETNSQDYTGSSLNGNWN